MVVFVEDGSETLLKIVTCGGELDPLDFTDLGASKSYENEVFKKICGSLPQTDCEVIRQVDRLEVGKPNLLREE